MAKRQQKAVAKSSEGVKSGPYGNFARTRALAGLGLETADVMGKQISNIFSDYVLTSDDPDPRIMLSAIGKRLNLEGHKLRAAQLAKSNGQRSDFFLKA